ncbi:hypothetical protein FACS1894200_06570 [Spirochaetia bacterium]|nr:hypothetical protein FACS1894200_06570 [Spirochaetia bacterium]
MAEPVGDAQESLEPFRTETGLLEADASEEEAMNPLKFFMISEYEEGLENDESVSGPSLYERCTAVLQQEKDLLQTISSMLAKVRQAVITRQWLDFDYLMDELSALGEEFNVLESARVALFQNNLGTADEQVGFYRLVLRFPLKERQEISALYRALKMDFLKVRIANDILSTYIEEAKTTAASFLEAAFPERKRGVYSRYGTPIEQDMRSLVLNAIV